MRNDGLFHLHPLVPPAICLILGIVAGGLLPGGVGVVWRISPVVVSLLLCLLAGRHPVVQSCAILAASFCCGCALIGIAERNYAVPLPAGPTIYEAVVTDEPVERGKTVRFDMLITSPGALCGRTVRASLLKDTVAKRYQQLSVGDGLTAYSEIEAPENFRQSNFDYVTYLKAHGIAAQTFIFWRNWQPVAPDLSRLTVWQRSRLSFMRLRHTMIERYRSMGLTGQDFAVAAAMTLGHRTEISPELRTAYSAAGVSHVLALSGMHLSVIYMLLSFLFLGRRFGLLRDVLLLVAVWLYVFMVGMPPSVVRSALMLSVYAIVGVTGRDRMSLNTLAFAALIMLVANPFCLYDVGFQLSFLSVASILVVHRSAGRLVSQRFQQNHRLLGWLWNLMVMSCAAQIATAPLVAYYFGTVSVYFLLANLVAVPAVTVILFITVVMLLFSFAPVFQQPLVTLLAFVITGLNDIFRRVASLPGSAVTGLHVTALQLFFIYFAIICLCLAVHILIMRRVGQR